MVTAPEPRLRYLLRLGCLVVYVAISRPSRLAAGCYHHQHLLGKLSCRLTPAPRRMRIYFLGKSTARLAVRCETALAPQYRRPQLRRRQRRPNHMPRLYRVAAALASSRACSPAGGPERLPWIQGDQPTHPRIARGRPQGLPTPLRLPAGNASPPQHLAWAFGAARGSDHGRPGQILPAAV